MREGFTNYRSRQGVVHAGVDRGEEMDFEYLTVCGVVLEDGYLESDKEAITCKRCLRVLGTIEGDIWGDEPDHLPPSPEKYAAALRSGDDGAF